MPRSRNIKPGLYKNEDLAECSIWARYVFAGLWTLGDREGRLEDRPKRIKGELLPFDGQDVEPLLQELASTKDGQGLPFIIRYQNGDGKFIQISKFLEHQSPHYTEKKSTIKPPELPEFVAYIRKLMDDKLRDKNNNKGNETPGGLPEDSGRMAGIKEGSKPPDSLIPDSLIPEENLEPSLRSPPPPSEPGGEAAPEKLPLRREDDPAKLARQATWRAFSEAYSRRYSGATPVQNAKANALVKQLVERLGAVEAPEVAAFYPTHPDPFYGRKNHPLELLVKDAEGIRTAWANRGVASQTRKAVV